MSAKDVSVCNTDLLQSAKFILSFPRISATQFFCQAINVPGISSQSTIQATTFSDLHIPGDKIQYDTLNIEFLLDEELQSWTSVHDWIRALTFPEDFKEYSNLDKLSKYSQQVKFPQYAEAELLILAANGTPKVKLHFIEAFPISLSGFQMDVRQGSDATLTANATFRYKRYNLIKM